MRCNICGCDQFDDINGRKNVRCVECRSVERTRLIKFVLDREFSLKPGMSVLHIAPEMGLSSYFLSIPNIKYDAVDLFPHLYRHCKVRKMDLVNDTEDLPSKAYDLIIHSHVMEHIPCNITTVLMHLHRALKDDGLHIFAIPIFSGCYEECLTDIGPDERRRRFYQDDHVRRFGRDDIHLTIGKIFRIPDHYSLRDQYPGIDFSALNIPNDATSGYSSNTILRMKKPDLKFALC